MNRQREQTPRQCPDCGAENTHLVPRGFAGATDERDQFFVCQACGRTTYEIISRTPKEIRVGRLEPGRSVTLAGKTYVVVRVLKAGANESLIYVKPRTDAEVTPGKLSAAATRPRQRHH